MRPRPIYVIGDSTALIFSDRLVKSSQPYIVRSVYCGLAAGALGDDFGRLAPALSNALHGTGALIEVADGYEPAHASVNDHVLSLCVCDDRPPEDPPLVLSCGLLDVGRIARELECEDLILPDGIEEEFETPPLCSLNEDDACPASEALTLVMSRLEGFAAGCHALREFGFGRIAMLSLAPITTDLLEIRKFYEAFHIPVLSSRLTYRFAYKLILLVNQAIATICRSENIHFINRWPHQTSNGLAREGLLLDAIHLTGEAAEQSTALILDWLQKAGSAKPAPRDLGRRHQLDGWQSQAIPGVSFSVQPAKVPPGPSPSVVRLSWSAHRAGTKTVKIFMKEPRNEEALFVHLGSEGSLETGPWVFAATVFTLRDAESNATLATFTVGHARPEIPW